MYKQKFFLFILPVSLIFLSAILYGLIELFWAKAQIEVSGQVGSDVVNVNCQIYGQIFNCRQIGNLFHWIAMGIVIFLPLSALALLVHYFWRIKKYFKNKHQAAV